jgi:hypothetical protein
LTADTIVTVSEWVATDSRAAPHTVCFVVGTGDTRRVLVVEKAAERIVQADLMAAVEASLRAHTCDAAITRLAPFQEQQICSTGAAGADADPTTSQHGSRESRCAAGDASMQG